jgi:hypothetical protein
MAGVISVVSGFLLSIYNWIVGLLPDYLVSSFNVLVFGVLIAIVAVFIWYFYKTLSQKNLIKLNLRQYNRSEHPVFSKLFAIILYLLEYIIIMPILIFVWFTALSIVLLLIANERTISQILLLTGAMVAGIRILAYYKSGISQDLAKLFPFITLSVFLLSPTAFSVADIIARTAEIPTLLFDVLSFILVIVVIEIILRIIYTIKDFWKSEGPVPVPKHVKASNEDSEE